MIDDVAQCGACGSDTNGCHPGATGYDGAPYPKKTDKAMCDELGDEEYMEAYVTELGGASLCSAADGEGCTDKEKGFMYEIHKVYRISPKVKRDRE